MDSLLANYASSDEEENQAPAKPVSSLAPPKSSLFNSLPPPKSKSKSKSGFDCTGDVDKRQVQIVGKDKPRPTSSTSLFSSLPSPKSSLSSSSSSASKRVVQFRPPTITNPGNLRDEEDEDADEGEQERKKKRSNERISPSSFLSSIIPAPRYSATLGTSSSATGTSRRSMIETNTSPSSVSEVSNVVVDPNFNEHSNESLAYYSGNYAIPDDGNVGSAPANGIISGNSDQAHEVYGGTYAVGSMDVVSGVSTTGSDAYSGSYEAIDYSYNTQYDNSWANRTSFPEVSRVAEDAVRFSGRRGRKDAPPSEIVEVKQDELMKNRPREDQVKSTGIAFGPAYQPASTKGKPSKLHKRKHQIGSLLFDMRQKEMELAERRSKGFLTKAQTQAKYGW